MACKFQKEISKKRRLLKKMKTVKTKKIGLIIFARMQSKRFPGKVLFNLYSNKSSLN